MEVFMRIQKKIELLEGIDYYINDDGFMVFTKEYHLKRGFCCKCGCLHCPYQNKTTSLDTRTEEN